LRASLDGFGQKFFQTTRAGPALESLYSLFRSEERKGTKKRASRRPFSRPFFGGSISSEKCWENVSGSFQPPRVTRGRRGELGETTREVSGLTTGKLWSATVDFGDFRENFARRVLENFSVFFKKFLIHAHFLYVPGGRKGGRALGRGNTRTRGPPTRLRAKIQEKWPRHKQTWP